MYKVFSFVWLLIIMGASIYMESVSYVSTSPKTDFSLSNVMSHIEIMASENHFMGTAANQKVRDYILKKFQELDIETEIFIGETVTNYHDSYFKLAKTENIIATIKGSENQKAVLIAGHYDSVLSAPGAADDIHAVACMLETARILKNSYPKNDIVFLITDGEEMGLLGAKAFVENKDLSQFGLVLNYEARGNSGPSISFEWSNGNAWLVNQVKEAGLRPIANSMSYEIYNRLPNDTDFTYFKRAGLSGINHAFIDGFSYYHNPADNPSKINQNSVLHTGKNMASLTKHFSNINLNNTVTHNASFFNFLGYLTIYPASLDIFILLITLLLICYHFYLEFKSNPTLLKNVILGFITQIILLLIISGCSYYLGNLLLKLYPHYSIFYSGQFYNHKTYCISSISIAIFMTSLSCYLIRKKISLQAFQSSSIILLGLISIAFYIMMPTATYFICLPTLSLVLSLLIKRRTTTTSLQIILPFIGILIPLAIWTPVVQNIFLAFSLKGLFGPAILCFIIYIGIIIANDAIWQQSKGLMGFSCLLLILSLGYGHITSQPTTDKPLPSSLIYNHNINDNKSHWVTNDGFVNIGNKNILNSPKVTSINLPSPVKRWTKETSIMSPIKITTIQNDTLNLSRVKLKYNDEAFHSRIYFNDATNVKSMNINGHTLIENAKLKQNIMIEIYGITQDSTHIEIEKQDIQKKCHFNLENRFLGLPQKDVIPSNSIRTDGYSSIVRTIKM